MMDKQNRENGRDEGQRVMLQNSVVWKCSGLCTHDLTPK